MQSNPQSSSGRRGPWLLFPVLLILSLAACTLGQAAQPTATLIPPTATSAQESPTGETPLPSPSVTPIAPGPTLTAGPSCTVLQDLNLRVGPGTAYNPPVIALAAGTPLLPTGFNPVGVPGGPWVQVQVIGTDQVGWVSAGTQFVSCNLDLPSLPPVDVPPPPKPPAPRIGQGDVDGDGISDFRSGLEYNPDYFVRMYVFRPDDSDEEFDPAKDGRGIVSVQFIVTSPEGDLTYYDRTENTPGYCIFGGGEPECNAWLLEGDQYKWVAGGESIVPGNYVLTIIVTATDGQVGNWTVPVYVALP